MADIDPRIPLAVQPTPFNPLGAAQAGMQMQGEKQLQQLRQQQIESFPQLQEAREQQLEAGRYENMVRQRNIAGTMEYVKALQAGMSDQDMVAHMTRIGFPEIADLHLERRAKSQQAWDASERAKLGLEQTHLATAISELDGIESSPNPELYYQGAVARLQHRFEADPGIGNWTTQLPVQYPGPEGLKGLRQTLQNRSAIIQRTLDPTGVAAKEAETRLHGAQADLAAAEAANLGMFGAKLTGKDAAAVKAVLDRDYPGRSYSELSGKEQADVLGKAAEVTQDPQMRSLLLSQKALAVALAQMNMNMMPTREDAAAIARGILNHQMAPSQLALFGGFGPQGAAFKRMVGLEVQRSEPEFNWEEAESVYNLVKSPGFQNTVRYMDSVLESMPRLQQTADKLSNSNVRFVNGVANYAKTQINDPTVKAFVTDALFVSDEIAKLLQGGGTGSATSDAKLRQAQSIIDTADSPRAIKSALTEANALIGFRRKALTRGTYLEKRGGGETNSSQQTQQTAAAPSAALLAGLPKHVPGQPWKGRRFNQGPNAGQTWGIDENGNPKRLDQ